MLALLLVAAAGSRAGAQEGPLLEGRVLLAGDSVPVPDLAVRLHRVTPDSGMVVDTAVTDAGGRFRFRLARAQGSVERGVRAVHMVSARYEGVLYVGRALHGGEVPADYRVVVHPARIASEGDTVTVAARTLVVSPEAGRTAVMDVMDLRAGGDSTLVGGEGGTPWWGMALPEGARDPRVLPGGLEAREVTFASGAVRSAAAIPPTGRRLVVGYGLKDDGIRLRLTRPVGRFELVFRGSPDDVRVTGLASAGSTRLGDDRFARYRAGGLAAGAVVQAEWGGAGGGRSTLAWVLLALGVLLAGGAVAAWRRLGGAGTGGGGPRRGAST